MRTIVDGITTAAFLLYFAIISVFGILIAFIVMLLTAPFDSERRALHKFSCLWGYWFIATWPFFRVDFRGRENIEPGKTYVLAANHQSMLDIMLLYGLFRHFKWVSKAENYRIPFVGWNMHLNQYIRLERGDRRGIVAMMKACADYLQRGSSILIFPEGTRSKDGRLQSFKSGPTAIAVRAGVPVVPIVHDGSWRAFAKNGLMAARRTWFDVRVLPAIETSSAGDADALSEQLHATMTRELDKIRAERGTAIPAPDEAATEDSRTSPQESHPHDEEAGEVHP